MGSGNIYCSLYGLNQKLPWGKITNIRRCMPPILDVIGRLFCDFKRYKSMIKFKMSKDVANIVWKQSLGAPNSKSFQLNIENDYQNVQINWLTRKIKRQKVWKTNWFAVILTSLCIYLFVHQPSMNREILHTCVK